MKNQYTITNAIGRSARFGLALAGLMLLANAASSSARSRKSFRVVTALCYSYEEWSAKYCSGPWASTNHLESLGETGICSAPQPRAISRPEYNRRRRDPHCNQPCHRPARTRCFLRFCLVLDNGNCPCRPSRRLRRINCGFDQQQWSAVTETSCTIDGVQSLAWKVPTIRFINVVSALTYTTRKTTYWRRTGCHVRSGDFSIYLRWRRHVPDARPAFARKHTIHTLAVIGPLSAPWLSPKELLKSPFGGEWRPWTSFNLRPDTPGASLCIA